VWAGKKVEKEKLDVELRQEKYRSKRRKMRKKKEGKWVTGINMGRRG